MPRSLHEFRQRLAADVLHAEEAGAVGLADVVNLDDVRVRELGGGVGLAGEPGDEHRVGRPPLAHHLEGDVAVERELPGEVDRAHAAAAEFAFDRVAAHVDPNRNGDFGLCVWFAAAGDAVLGSRRCGCCPGGERRCVTTRPRSPARVATSDLARPPVRASRRGPSGGRRRRLDAVRHDAGQRPSANLDRLPGLIRHDEHERLAARAGTSAGTGPAWAT